MFQGYVHFVDSKQSLGPAIRHTTVGGEKRQLVVQHGSLSGLQTKKKNKSRVNTNIPTLARNTESKTTFASRILASILKKNGQICSEIQLIYFLLNDTKE
jgi:hypothetical protein